MGPICHSKARPADGDTTLQQPGAIPYSSPARRAGRAVEGRGDSGVGVGVGPQWWGGVLGGTGASSLGLGGRDDMVCITVRSQGVLIRSTLVSSLGSGFRAY